MTDVAKQLIERVHDDAALSKMQVSLSVGCTSWCVTLADYKVNHLLKQADDALYYAKNHGRNQYIVYEHIRNLQEIT